MLKRPLSISLIAWLFILTGVVSLLKAMDEFSVDRPYHLVPVYIARALSIVCGVYVLRGQNWARWLLVAWLAFHVGLGLSHSYFQFLVHGALAGIIVYFLFRRTASDYFRNASAEPVTSAT